MGRILLHLDPSPSEGIRVRILHYLAWRGTFYFALTVPLVWLPDFRRYAAIEVADVSQLSFSSGAGRGGGDPRW
jgi:hypothetical protein